MFIISEKQRKANKQNAQHSTGPKTEEGKKAVRFNALKHGLRAEATLLPNEDPAQFEQLCTEFEDQWGPQNKTERLLVEQMCVHQWRLRRLALEERRYLAGMEKGYSTLPIVDQFAKMTARLENSFLRTLNELTKLQKARLASVAVNIPKAPKIHPPHPEPPPGESPSPGHAYIMQPQTPQATINP